MGKDSETLDGGKRNTLDSGDDMAGMTVSMFGRINFKQAIFIFLMGILIFSNIFIENVLSKFDGAESSGEATTKGTVLQLIVLVLGYLIVDLLIQGSCL